MILILWGNYYYLYGLEGFIDLKIECIDDF